MFLFSDNIFYCNNAQTAKRIKKNLKKDHSNLDDLFKELNAENSMSFSYSNDIFEEGQKEVLNAIKWKNKGFKNVGDFNGRYVMVKFKKVYKPQAKPLASIRGLVIADYQDQLEKEWVAELRNKYTVEINQEIVDSLYK